MKNNVTELVFILDRSGSMAELEKDTIGGFNAMIEKQKQNDTPCYVSTILFNGVSYVLHDRVRLNDVGMISEREYAVGGGTALLDAIGGAIHHIGTLHKYLGEDAPAHTMFIITTDGQENASHRYDCYRVKEMIERQKKRFGWEFIFLGANIDAVETAARYGIGADRAANYHCDGAGTALNYEVMSDAIFAVRTKASLGPDWKKKIDKDFKNRSKKKS